MGGRYTHRVNGLEGCESPPWCEEFRITEVEGFDEEEEEMSSRLIEMSYTHLGCLGI